MFLVHNVIQSQRRTSRKRHNGDRRQMDQSDNNMAKDEHKYMGRASRREKQRTRKTISTSEEENENNKPTLVRSTIQRNLSSDMLSYKSSPARIAASNMEHGPCVDSPVLIRSTRRRSWCLDDTDKLPNLFLNSRQVPELVSSSDDDTDGEDGVIFKKQTKSLQYSTSLTMKEMKMARNERKSTNKEKRHKKKRSSKREKKTKPEPIDKAPMMTIFFCAMILLMLALISRSGNLDSRIDIIQKLFYQQKLCHGDSQFECSSNLLHSRRKSAVQAFRRRHSSARRVRRYRPFASVPFR